MDDTQKQSFSQTPQDQKAQENTVFQFVKPIPVIQDDTPQTVAQVPDATKQQPVSVPVGNTEGSPVSIIHEPTKWIEASEPQEVQLPPELAEVGISIPQDDKPDLDEDARNAGIDYAPPLMPVTVEPEISRIKLPMTEEEAKKVMAHPNPSSSLYWLAMTMLRQLAWFKHNPPEKQV